jgi:hypothetical protein
VFGIAVDATSVYWATDVPNGSPTFTTDCAVMKMPVAGGAATVLGKEIAGRGYDIAVDATRLYLTFQWNNFDNEGEIHTLALATGAEGPLLGIWLNDPRGIAAGPSYAYWGDEVQGKLLGASPAGGPAPRFGPPAIPIGTTTHGIAVDATSVYTTDDTPAPGGGQILQWPAGGGMSVMLVAGQAGPNYIAADATNLYWTNLGNVNGVMQDHQGSVVKMPKAGGAVTTLASGLGGAKRIAVDATHVYWNDDVDGVIMKVPIAGGASTVLASGQLGANGLAVGATYVYWTDSMALTVMRIAK